MLLLIPIVRGGFGVVVSVAHGGGGGGGGVVGSGVRAGGINDGQTGYRLAGRWGGRGRVYE